MVGFIGGGKMAQALAKGFISSGLVKARNIFVSDINSKTLEITKALGCQVTAQNNEVVNNTDMVFLAVKPHLMQSVLDEIKPIVDPKKTMVVSIAVGVTLNTLEKGLPDGTRVVRVMPNTASLIQQGASVISTGTHATSEDGESVAKLLQTVGMCESGLENIMDAVTGLSGCGPAYAYVAIEALADGGVKMGLPREMSTKLAAQTVLGSAKMVLETGRHPGSLKDDVCSPFGSTIYAVHSLEQNGFRGSLIGAVEAAALRAKELGGTKK